ncbi:uncharacterized protein DUF2188 [Mycoplasma testudineum]|uniref:Uncharacterized protein DUF2188 n=1 Tax=Mycoplasma testudineum TaxID=244584 RepID=A0A4R6IFQ2_9MOLU|nr:DUF2188 domain-containing protein [Mycoplasma testudineum]OYD26982.1 hypothetical protein CG473_01445 [Mycoplasma testudineum]TDO20528.1 uncharacterized protein DUF2188 [Mycoplasma testudineum]
MNNTRELSTTYYVVAGKDEKGNHTNTWVIKRGNSVRKSDEVENKPEAVKRAKELADKIGGKVIVYLKNGSIDKNY